MLRRNVFVAALVAATTLIPTQALLASPLHISPVRAFFGKTKMVKLNLRNDSGAPIELRAGETVMTLHTGETKVLALPPGTRITTTAATKSHEAGALIAEVSETFSGATISIH